MLQYSGPPALTAAVQALREPREGYLTQPDIPRLALEETALEPKSPGTVTGQILEGGAGGEDIRGKGHSQREGLEAIWNSFPYARLDLTGKTTSTCFTDGDTEAQTGRGIRPGHKEAEQVPESTFKPRMRAKERAHLPPAGYHVPCSLLSPERVTALSPPPAPAHTRATPEREINGPSKIWRPRLASPAPAEPFPTPRDLSPRTAMAA